MIYDRLRTLGVNLPDFRDPRWGSPRFGIDASKIQRPPGSSANTHDYDPHRLISLAEKSLADLDDDLNDLERNRNLHQAIQCLEIVYRSLHLPILKLTA